MLYYFLILQCKGCDGVNKKRNSFVGVICIGIVLTMLSGCSYIISSIKTLKGELLGNSYNIWEYDNYGNRILSLTGDKVALEGGVDENCELTSYMDITIDGYEWEHVGGTLVFAQKNVDMITDFQVPSNMKNPDGSTGLIAVDRVINNYRNKFGKKSVVVVYSQTGAPICMFQGNDCYTEIPSDLPKTTKIYIDGGLVYVHRANIDIFPAKMFK